MVNISRAILKELDIFQLNGVLLRKQLLTSDKAPGFATAILFFQLN